MAGKTTKRKRGKFTVKEIRGILLLLPLIAVMLWIVWAASRPRIGDSATIAGDELIAENVPLVAATVSRSESAAKKSIAIEEAPKADPKPFDPNTATYEDFRALGIDKSTARNIVKYRERGKRFEIPEDLAVCYGVTDSMYAALRPYIIIGEEYRLKPKEQKPEKAPAKEPAKAAVAVPKLVEINTADSAELVSVKGIGAKTAQAIIEYRQALGGFYSIDQITELKVVNETNWERMSKEIWADSCEIQKIDINFAHPNTVKQHPYMVGKKAGKLLSHRQMRGGWRTIEDMIEQDILTPEEAAKLAPYLQFRVE